MLLHLKLLWKSISTTGNWFIKHKTVNADADGDAGCLGCICRYLFIVCAYVLFNYNCISAYMGKMGAELTQLVILTETARTEDWVWQSASELSLHLIWAFNK